jgi:hypothetical protein
MFGASSYAHYKHACSQGIKRAAMAHFEELVIVAPPPLRLASFLLFFVPSGSL